MKLGLAPITCRTFMEGVSLLTTAGQAAFVPSSQSLTHTLECASLRMNEGGDAFLSKRSHLESNILLSGSHSATTQDCHIEWESDVRAHLAAATVAAQGKFAGIAYRSAAAAAK